MISIDPEKMAPVLNHIVKNEGTQSSLYGILAYVGSSMFHKTLKTDIFRTLVLALLKLLIIGINAEKNGSGSESYSGERRYTRFSTWYSSLCWE